MSVSGRKKVVICRVSPNFKDSKYRASYMSLALGAFSVRNYCMANPDIAARYDIEVKTFHVRTETEKIVSELTKDEPYMIGFSSYYVDYLKTIEVAAEVKKRLPRAMLIAGGPQFFDAPHQLSKHGFLDFVIPFEGELPFEELLMSLAAGRGPENVAGLAYRDTDGGVRFTGERHDFVDMNKIPPLHTDDFLERITDTAILQTSRGCAHACGYCAYSRDKYHEASLDRVLDELKRILDKPDIVHIIFADLDLAFDIERFNKLLDFFLARNDKRVMIDAFWCSLPKIAGSLGKMRAAGFRTEFDISLQSVSDEVLAISRRKWLLFPKMMEIVPQILWYFPTASVELILGLPGETLESFMNDHLRLFENGIRGFNAFELMLLPGSEFYERHEELGLEWRDEVTYNIKRSPTFTEEQLEEAKRFSTNFQILSWILQPEDVPLYRKWGIDMPGVAVRMTNLKEHSNAKYDMGITASEVSETAIDAFAGFLVAGEGFPPEKAEIIRKYVHFKYRISKFRMDCVLVELDKPEQSSASPVAQFMELPMPEGVDKFLSIESVPKRPENAGAESRCFAVCVRGARKVVLTESADADRYRRLLEVSSAAGSVIEIPFSFRKDEHKNILDMMARLAELGLMNGDDFKEYMRAHSIFAAILKKGDYAILEKRGMEITDVSECADMVEGISENDLDFLLSYMAREYADEPERLHLLNEYMQVKFKTALFEKRRMEEKRTGLIGGYVEFTAGADVLEMLNISGRRIEASGEGRTPVFAIYNPKFESAVFLSGRDNDMLRRLLETASVNGTESGALEAACLTKSAEAAKILTRLREAGFFDNL